MFYIGIDPGVSGGIVLCDETKLIKQTMMPSSYVETYETLCEYCVNTETVIAIERCSARPTDAVNRAFTYGMHYGSLIAFISLMKKQYDTVLPRIWKNYFKIPDKADSSYFGKSIDVALSYDPEIRNEIKLKKQNGVLDAYLIAQYFRLNNKF